MLNSQARNTPIQKILIVGGGTAGWMAAAALSKALTGLNISIELIESDTIGTVGVGEATIPDIISFNQQLELNEDEFMRATQATFKLGIEFVNWRKIGDSYLHPFSSHGKDINSISFHHYWLKYFNQGKVPELEEFSLSAQAARTGKFSRMKPIADLPFPPLVYAFQFDAGLYAKYLRCYAEARHVKRTEGIIQQVVLASDTGSIQEVILQSGAKIRADFFIDCSGFKSLLLGEALQVGFDDWQHWLPCDRALAVPCENTAPPPPYTRATAHAAGWQWRIPLQHRTGNGHVFSSNFMEAEQAEKILLDNLPGPTNATPKLLRFKTGVRKVFWEKNCIALGLSSGFMEPLESTSIHLVQAGITKFLALFPNGINDDENRRVYNSRSSHSAAGIRDFLILHYKATSRTDSEFWRYCANMSIPDSLANKIRLYQETGHIFREDNELFSLPSWLAVMHGQGIRCKQHHPLADAITESEALGRLAEIHSGIRQLIKTMPSHGQYIDRFCKSDAIVNR